MKLYFENIKPHEISIQDISQYKRSSNYLKTIISEEGIFRIKKDNIERCIINDVPIINTHICNLNAIIDKSNLMKVEEVSQIPPHHGYSEWIYDIYKLQPNAALSFVVGKCNNRIGDAYFECCDTEVIQTIQEDIHTFLNKLKIC